MFRKVLLVVVPLMLLVIILTQVTSARMFRNFFLPEGAAIGNISHGGRVVVVNALIECTAGERLSVEVTLSQGSQNFDILGEEAPNAVGHGRTNAVCEGQDQEIPVRVTAQGRETFVPGPATASGLAITTERGEKTDVRQWQPSGGVTLQ